MSKEEKKEKEEEEIPALVKVVKEPVVEVENEDPDYEDIEITDKEIEDFRG